MTDGRELSTAALRTTRSWSGRILLIVFGVGIGIASSVAVVDSPSDFRTVAADADAFAAAGPEVVGDESVAEGGPAVGNRKAGPSGGPAAAGPNGAATAEGPLGGDVPIANPEQYKCEEGENGGSTDKGVTGNSIKVAANVVQDGVGASFLKEAKIGIEAVFDEVNVEGICGRKIILTTRNDKWDAATGMEYIRNYIADGVFALAVNPSSEGLDLATQTRVIANEGIPVVGSDGMLISQYRLMKDGQDLASWIWPITPSTITTMHVIAQQGIEAKAATFGLVWDEKYKFGTEGREAFVEHLKRLGVPTNKIYDQKITPGREQYTQEANTFNNGCDAMGGCDLVAMLLDSSTAVTWIKANADFGELVTSGPQTLFNDAFATNCEAERKKLPGGKHCDLIVWTGYNPPVGGLANLPGVSEYVSAIKARDGQADTSNSFTQGAYLGARVFVEALKEVGPNLTRANLKRVLDNFTYSSDLVNPGRPLRWTAGNHFANVTMHAFRVGYTPDQGFTGWAPETEWYTDSHIGQV
ncbi:MAG TPA: ABC transporter substrate-binding protein [Acidimicrobiia bacterium]|nr:ABC transporter substrate-binding protein [Acidimicrobiia bacterium]